MVSPFFDSAGPLPTLASRGTPPRNSDDSPAGHHPVAADLAVLQGHGDPTLDLGEKPTCKGPRRPPPGLKKPGPPSPEVPAPRVFSTGRPVPTRSKSDLSRSPWSLPRPTSRARAPPATSPPPGRPGTTGRAAFGSWATARPDPALGFPPAWRITYRGRVEPAGAIAGPTHRGLSGVSTSPHGAPPDSTRNRHPGFVPRVRVCRHCEGVGSLLEGVSGGEIHDWWRMAVLPRQGPFPVLAPRRLSPPPGWAGL